MRSDDVVPVPMEAVAFQVDTLHLLVGDSPPGGVFSAVQTTDDLQALRGRRPSDQVDDGFVVAQRLASPIRGNEREEAMLDLVPLAGARREMTHRQRPSRSSANFCSSRSWGQGTMTPRFACSPSRTAPKPACARVRAGFQLFLGTSARRALTPGECVMLRFVSGER
jgi:hypothetical protein